MNKLTFEVISTGKNYRYGQAGEIIRIADSALVTALKNDWIEPKVKYLTPEQNKNTKIPIASTDSKIHRIEIYLRKERELDFTEKDKEFFTKILTEED